VDYSKTGFEEIRGWVLGLDKEVPLATGERKRYTFLDNAASTPMLKPIADKVNEFLGWYSSIHRGTGFKSSVATHAYESAREVILGFVGAKAETHTAVFTVNTTEAINKLSCCLPIPDDAVVMVSPLEHHSNDLPWRHRAEVVFLPLDEEYRVDLAATEKLVESLAGRLFLIAISGASNVTGQLTPFHELAKIAHANGVRILVDAAQLAPHVAIDMTPDEPGAQLDFLVIAGHKMYAPLGGAALIGRLDAMTQCKVACRGGGTIKLVTRERVEWAPLPDLLEAGTPNVVGAVALAAAAKTLLSIGFDRMHQREQELTQRLLIGMNAVPGITIYGSADPEKLDDRLGVVAFNLKGYDHALLAAILSCESGIGVRNGCFCAHPFVADLMEVDPEEFERFANNMLNGDRSELPGMVRISLGIYNNEAEVDSFLAKLRDLVENGAKLEYTQTKCSGAYLPKGWQPHPEEHFSI